MNQYTFDIVVVTAPTKVQCEIYFTLCNHIKSSISQFHHTSFFCVHDPLNARVGSGGGTLNAIDYLNHTLQNTEHPSSLNLHKTLIVHSGGDSRRSPLHSVCGKAWATLNYSVDEDKSFAASPILLLLVEFDLFFSKLTQGSIVVASSDVLLDIHKVAIDHHCHLKCIHTCYCHIFLT